MITTHTNNLPFSKDKKASAVNDLYTGMFTYFIVLFCCHTEGLIDKLVCQEILDIALPIKGRDRCRLLILRMVCFTLLLIFQMNALDTLGQTALHRAALAGHLQTCRLLLNYGSDPSIISLQGFTAAQIGNEAVQQILSGM